MLTEIESWPIKRGSYPHVTRTTLPKFSYGMEYTQMQRRRTSAVNFLSTMPRLWALDGSNCDEKERNRCVVELDHMINVLKQSCCKEYMVIIMLGSKDIQFVMDDFKDIDDVRISRDENVYYGRGLLTMVVITNKD